MNYDPAVIAQGLTRTDPPPSPEARGLRAIGRNLDVLGELAGEHAAKLSTVIEMGETDARTLARVERKLDDLIALLTAPDTGLVRRTSELEGWRGEHEAAHARQ